MGNSSKDFWQFSCQLYGQQQVSETCLTLQDRYGLDVNLILFALWLATLHRQFTPQLAEKAGHFSRHWQRQRVRPLRELRRKMKTGISRVAMGRQPEYAQLRESILTTELGAERLQQRALARLAAAELPVTSASNLAAAMHANLNAVCAESGVESDSQLRSLIALLVRAASENEKRLSRE